MSRHGQPGSSSETLVHAVRPRVTIMNNGSRKGGQPSAMNVLLNSPGLEDLWQIHFALLGGQEYTAPLAPQAAPPRGTPAQAPAHNAGPAYWLKVSAQTDHDR